MKMAELSRVKDLDPKLIACDPLPDVDRETDLNYFITQWRETKDKDLKGAIEQAQVAEDVIRSMQFKKGEALAMHDSERLEWCRQYTDKLREIELRKFDEISAHIFEYIDVYTKNNDTDKLQTEDKRRNARGDNSRVDTMEDQRQQSKDLFFGIWANVQGKHKLHVDIPFGNYDCQLPVKQSNVPIILRCLWTNYDYLSQNEKLDDFIVGGIVDFQLYQYPDICKVIPKQWTIRTILTVE